MLGTTGQWDAGRRRPWMTWIHFFFASRRRHTRFDCDWSSDVCSSDFNRESAVFIFIFPIMLFVLLASVYGGTTTIDGITRPTKYALLAGLLSYGAANTAFAGLAITLVIRRESGLLKRLRSTPLPAPAYLAAVVASLLVVFVLQTVSLFVIGRVAFGTRLPHNVASLVLLVLIGVAGFCGLGFGVTALIRSAGGSSAGGDGVLLPLA